MKHALNKIGELINNLQASLDITTTSVEGADVFLVSYDIGDEKWLTIITDHDIDDAHPIGSDCGELHLQEITLEEGALAELYDKLKNIYEK